MFLLHIMFYLHFIVPIFVLFHYPDFAIIRMWQLVALFNCQSIIFHHQQLYQYPMTYYNYIPISFLVLTEIFTLSLQIFPKQTSSIINISQRFPGLKSIKEPTHVFHFFPNLRVHFGILLKMLIIAPFLFPYPYVLDFFVLLRVQALSYVF